MTNEQNGNDRKWFSCGLVAILIGLMGLFVFMAEAAMDAGLHAEQAADEAGKAATEAAGEAEEKAEAVKVQLDLHELGQKAMFAALDSKFAERDARLKQQFESRDAIMESKFDTLRKYRGEDRLVLDKCWKKLESQDRILIKLEVAADANSISTP